MSVNKKKQVKYKLKSSIRPLVIIFIGILILNIYQPLVSDDFVFKVTNIDKSAITRTYINYFDWTGRIVPMYFLNLFMSYPKYIFNVVNSLMFILMIVGMYINIKDEIRKNKFTLLIIVLVTLVWFETPAFGETVVWQTGAHIYLWATTLSLYFIYYFNKMIRSEESKNTLLVSMLNFLFGLVVGLTYENLVLGIIVGLVSIILVKREKSKKVIMLLSGVIVGAIILFVAPGNGKRLATLPHTTTLENIKNNIYMFDVVTEFKILFVMMIVALCYVVYIIEKKEITFKEMFSNYFLEFVIGIVSVGSMFAAPQFPLRALFQGVIYVIIFSVNILLLLATKYNLLENKKRTTLIKIFCSIMLVVSYKSVLQDYKKHRLAFNEREDIIYKKFANEQEIYIPKLLEEKKYQGHDRYMMIGGTRHMAASDGEEKTMWINNCYEMYYKKEKIYVVDREAYNFIVGE